MIVKNTGVSLSHLLPELVGEKISEWFDLKKPLTDFKFQNVRLIYSHFTWRIVGQ